MIFIKYILIFFVFLAFTYIGNTYSKKYVNRVQELEKMENLLNIFKSKIKFTGLTIQEIFNQIYDDNKDVVGDIFKRASLNMENMSAKDGWKKAIEESQDKLSLNKEDYTAIGTLGKMLGNTDVEGQVSQIELTEKLIHKLKCKYNKLKIDYIDERLTTVAAHKTMNFLNINKHKKRNIVDTISAVYILETYMEKEKNS